MPPVDKKITDLPVNANPPVTGVVQVDSAGVSYQTPLSSLRPPLVATHTFTQNELTHLVATPITLIPTPGPNLVIVYTDVFFVQDTLAGAYAYAGGAGGANLGVTLDPTGLNIEMSASADMTIAQKLSRIVTGTLLIGSTDLVPLANFPLVVTLEDGTSGNPAIVELIGGNVASKCYVSIRYYIVPTNIP